MPNPNPTPTPQPARKPFAPAPGFSTLQQYIQAAAASVASPSVNAHPDSSDSSASSTFSSLSALYHLAVGIFTAARAATRCLTEHYQAHPHALTPDLRARLLYCAERLKAIFHTLCLAPARFFSAGQFRALYRAQAVLAHLWRQPVDFGPLIPWLTAPENCPAPAKGDPAILPASSSLSLSTPRSELHSLDAQRSTLRPSSDPLLLQNPGRTLTSVLLQLSAIYGLSTAYVPNVRPVSTPTPAGTQPEPQAAPRLNAPSPASNPASPQCAPHSTLRPPEEPPLHPPP